MIISRIKKNKLKEKNTNWNLDLSRKNCNSQSSMEEIRTQEKRNDETDMDRHINKKYLAMKMNAGEIREWSKLNMVQNVHRRTFYLQRQRKKQFWRNGSPVFKVRNDSESAMKGRSHINFMLLWTFLLYVPHWQLAYWNLEMASTILYCSLIKIVPTNKN